MPSPTDLLYFWKSPFHSQGAITTYLPIAFHLISFGQPYLEPMLGISCYWQDEKDAGEDVSLVLEHQASSSTHPKVAILLGNMLVLL